MMTRAEFRHWCAAKIRILDGATGTELLKRGMPAGVCPELWVVEHPEAITDVQQAYACSGSELVYAPTFGGNAVKLAEFGLAARAFELNRRLAEISCRAVAAAGVRVFGDMAPTGRFIEPAGDWSFEEAVQIYRAQAEALAAGGVDGFAVETMMDLQEARAALIGIREVAPDAPVLVTLTFEASGRTLTGVLPEAALIALQALGADAFGCNCSTGPGDMAKTLARIAPYARIPLVAKPNAGLPLLKDGKTVFSMNPRQFADCVPTLLAAQVNLLGGCCGTTPEHIRQAARATLNASVPHYDSAAGRGVIAGFRAIAELKPDAPFTVIGERINPTGKKALQAELRANSTALALDFALEQAAAGAGVLDVNMGLSGIDERAMMRRVVLETARAVETPLCIDSTRPEVVEAALRVYPGRALLNSISLERERIEKSLPIAARYGAMPILLPLDDRGLPDNCSERIAILEKLLEAVAAYGYQPGDVAVDALIMAVSAAPGAANAALDFIDYCHNKLGVNTVCGLSNVSFGLPNRALVNRTFLAMAMARGLNLAIANPMNGDLMETIRAGEALTARDTQMRRYLAAQSTAAASGAAAGALKTPPAPKKPSERVFEAVLRGDAETIVRDCEAALAEEKLAPKQLLDEQLLPAIRLVGERFEKKEYFLPQLLAGAAALQNALHFLEPRLKAAGGAGGPREKIILATVKGDIHDIGKNIVGVMLNNSGFKVIDLGKDVPREVIVERAQAENCRLIGLSALMTTTMTEMPKVIALAREKGLQAAFIVGGAVVDGEFAQSIGAHYAPDAMATVKVANELLKK